MRHQNVGGFQVLVKDTCIVKIIQSLQNIFNKLWSTLLWLRSIFLNILLQSSFPWQLHDNRNFLLSEIDLMIGRDFLIPEFFQSIDQNGTLGWYFDKVCIGPKLINNLISVLFFIQLIKWFVYSTMMAHSNQFLPIVAIVGRKRNSV